MKTYNKLIRDNIPDIIKRANQNPITRVLNEKEFELELNKKLQEELNEYIQSGDIMELVDIGEVMHAILKLKNVSIEEYQRLRKEKLEEKGAFDKRIFLEAVE